jgi:hypothetical protein
LVYTGRSTKRYENWFDRTQIIFVWIVVLSLIVITLCVCLGQSSTKPMTAPTPSSTSKMYNLQGLSIPIEDNWATMGNEESLTVQEPSCSNGYGKGCGVLIVVVKTDHSDPDDFLQAYKDSCKEKAVRYEDRKIGFLNARYYVIDPCDPKSNTSSSEIRSLWYIPGVVTVLETRGLGQKRMAGVDEALAGAIWQ